MTTQWTCVVQDTVRWFTSHPSVKDGGIGVVAVSGGAAFALIMGWKFPEVKVVFVLLFVLFFPFTFADDRFNLFLSVSAIFLQTQESLLHSCCISMIPKVVGW